MEKEHEKYVVRGEEPPFDLEDMLWPYAPSPPNPEVLAPQTSAAPAKKSIRAFCFHTQGWLKTFVLLYEFSSCMLVVGFFLFEW